jgi:hypothetical protein
MSATLDDVLACLQRIEAQGARTATLSTTVNVGGSAGGEVATDADLDGGHGNPTIKYDPRPTYWAGPSFAGKRFSETTPSYLEATAKYLDACAHMAEKDADEKKRNSARYKRLDAARARGWAARLAGGWQPKAAPIMSADFGDGDDIPPF